MPLFPDTGFISQNSAILVALITSIAPTIVAIIALMQVIKSKKAIQEVHLSINSRMTELLKSVRGEATAEGREIGRKEK
jgi:hypothetical protein